MKPTQIRRSGASALLGLVFFAAGVAPMLAAFDIGPLGREDIQGPPWLGFAAGGSFVAAGLAVMAGSRESALNGLFAILALAGLAAIGNWVAFGVGERACSGSISLPWAWGAGDLTGLACRIPFGFGALITDAFLFWIVVSVMQKALGGPPRLARLLKAAEWLILASIAPILLVLLVSVLISGAVSALKARWTTGAWRRNEAFVVRQKAKGLLCGFGRKPPGDSA